MDMKRRSVSATILATMGVACSSVVSAQSSDGRWHYLFEPYLMIPNMNGDIGLGDLPPVHINEGPDDIVENLQIGAMFYVEAHNDRWAFASDLVYMDLEADISQNGLIAGGTGGATQLGWELSALARLSPWIELGAAATYNRLESDVRIDTQGGTTFGASMTQDWVDPSIVVRATVPLGEKWFLQGRGNIGGWGVGSDLYWQVQGDVGYRHSPRLLFTFGYRYIAIDYDHGSGPDRFIYKVDSFGPTLKVGFTF